MKEYKIQINNRQMYYGNKDRNLKRKTSRDPTGMQPTWNVNFRIALCKINLLLS